MAEPTAAGGEQDDVPPRPGAVHALDKAVSAIDGVVPATHSPANEVYQDRSRTMPWFGVILGAAALLLVPWVFYLGASLPERQLSAHYDVAWAGFDVFLFVALAATSYAVLRRAPWMGMAAGAAAALLVTDAWFDVVTSPTTSDTVQALAMAVVVELPLAGLCVWLCGHADRLADRRIRILMGRTRRSTPPA